MDEPAAPEVPASDEHPQGGTVGRRAALLGGTAVVGGVVGAVAMAQRADSATTGGQYIWAMHKAGFEVPSDTWTRVPWDWVLLNTTPATLEDDQTGWVFPASSSGVYGILANVAWDNAVSPTGEPIRPRTHRKLARIPQQGLTGTDFQQAAFTAASTDLTYHEDLAATGSQSGLSDGSLGYQQQQVYIQAGFEESSGDQRYWIEVYQDSGIPLVCRYDGTSAPATDDRPTMYGIQAPSLMIAKLCEW